MCSETPTASGAGEFMMAEALRATTAFIDRPLGGAEGAAAGSGRYIDDRESEK